MENDDNSDELLETQLEIPDSLPSSADSLPSSPDLLPLSLPAQNFAQLQRAASMPDITVRRNNSGIRNRRDSNSDNDTSNVPELRFRDSPLTRLPPLIEREDTIDETIIDIDQEDGNSTDNHDEHSQEVTTREWVFVAMNFVAELLSAIFDQLSSARKPKYALISMLISLVTMLIFVIEFVYKGRRARVKWMWKKGMLPWFYYPSQRNHRLFGSFVDIIGFVCGFFQCISTTIAYVFMSRDEQNPIKISFWPIIFASGLLCSKFLGNRRRRAR